MGGYLALKLGPWLLEVLTQGKACLPSLMNNIPVPKVTGPWLSGSRTAGPGVLTSDSCSILHSGPPSCFLPSSHP